MTASSCRGIAIISVLEMPIYDWINCSSRLCKMFSARELRNVLARLRQVCSETAYSDCRYLRS